MTVYVIHAQGTDLIKIGWTRALTAENRRRDLQISNPHKLVVIGLAVSAPTFVEKKYHRMLEAFRVRNEWFQLDHDERVRLVMLLEKEPQYKPEIEKELMRLTGLSTKNALRGYVDVEPWVKK